MATNRMVRLLACSLATLVLALGTGCSAGSGSTTSTDGNAPSAAETTASRYTLTPVSGTPDWTTVPVLDIAEQPWGDPVDISAHAQICYGDDALYVRMWAREADIRAEYAADDVLGNPYQDSCLEFFFAPVADDSRYVNIEMNPNCCTCVEVGTSRDDRVRLLPGNYLAPTSTRTDDGWEVVYRVPYDFIRLMFPDFAVASGGEMRANFYKCGNLTVHKHYLIWSPTTSAKPDFHRPGDFGVLVFG